MRSEPEVITHPSITAQKLLCEQGESTRRELHADWTAAKVPLTRQYRICHFQRFPKSSTKWCQSNCALVPTLQCLKNFSFPLLLPVWTIVRKFTVAQDPHRQSPDSSFLCKAVRTCEATWFIEARREISSFFCVTPCTLRVHRWHREHDRAPLCLSVACSRALCCWFWHSCTWAYPRVKWRNHLNRSTDQINEDWDGLRINEISSGS